VCWWLQLADAMSKRSIALLRIALSQARALGCAEHEDQVRFCVWTSYHLNIVKTYHCVCVWYAVGCQWFIIRTRVPSWALYFVGTAKFVHTALTSFGTQRTGQHCVESDRRFQSSIRTSAGNTRSILLFTMKIVIQWIWFVWFIQHAVVAEISAQRQVCRFRASGGLHIRSRSNVSNFSHQVCPCV
jgi:hypothetical protein